MLNLIDARTDDEVDERWFYDYTQSADLILVSGIVQSGYDVVCSALSQVGPGTSQWKQFALLLNGGLLASGMESQRSPNRWNFGELESSDSATLEALASRVKDGDKALTCIHAIRPLVRLNEIYKNCGLTALFRKSFANKRIALIEVLRPQRGGDVFVKTSVQTL